MSKSSLLKSVMKPIAALVLAFLVIGNTNYCNPLCNYSLFGKRPFQLLLSLGDGGEGKYDTNINFLLEDYGIMVNSDSVVRTSYYKYFHPKVCHIFYNLQAKIAKINRFSPP